MLRCDIQERHPDQCMPPQAGWVSTTLVELKSEWENVKMTFGTLFLKQYHKKLTLHF